MGTSYRGVHPQNRDTSGPPNLGGLDRHRLDFEGGTTPRRPEFEGSTGVPKLRVDTMAGCWPTTQATASPKVNQLGGTDQLFPLEQRRLTAAETDHCPEKKSIFAGT
ncbi:hypothetical protein U1Q18_044826 [Sarracenia purpurea var. burkii]